MKNRLSQFEREMLTGESVDVNGHAIKWAKWNLVVTNRDLNLYVKTGMKPHRHWRITDVKKYFGLTGSGEKMLKQFTKIYKQYTQDA